MSHQSLHTSLLENVRKENFSIFQFPTSCTKLHLSYIWLTLSQPCTCSQRICTLSVAIEETKSSRLSFRWGKRKNFIVLYLLTRKLSSVERSAQHEHVTVQHDRFITCTGTILPAVKECVRFVVTTPRRSVSSRYSTRRNNLLHRQAQNSTLVPEEFWRECIEFSEIDRWLNAFQVTSRILDY